MKHLFIARHGNYGHNNRLDRYGREQMNLLGNSIRAILDGDSVYIVSSTALRALDGAYLLKAQLASPHPVEQVPYLWSDGDAPRDGFYWCPNLEKLMSLVDKWRHRADGLIVVCHFAVAEEFTRYFLEKEFGQRTHMGGLAKGTAVHLNLEQRTYQVLPKVHRFEP